MLPTDTTTLLSADPAVIVKTTVDALTTAADAIQDARGVWHTACVDFAHTAGQTLAILDGLVRLGVVPGVGSRSQLAAKAGLKPRSLDAIHDQLGSGDPERVAAAVAAVNAAAAVVAVAFDA